MLTIPCSICNCMGHTEKYCEKPLIKITLPNYYLAKEVLLFSSDNNWKIGKKMRFNSTLNEWVLEKNFKFGRW